jgi:4-diphosphocytidyl-2-C-methyl-D-erythritol kinase
VAYADATGWPATFAIEVVKHVPVGGGLGGGSADAGAVLRALDALAPSPLGHRLPELASALGADVPFLTLEHPMSRAWGRGERLLSIPALTSRPVVLIVPRFSVATAEAFAWLAAARGAYQPQAAVMTPSDVATWEALAAHAANDFEGVVAIRHPEIARYVDALRSEGAVPALMTGSGSTGYGVLDDLVTAARVAGRMEEVFVADGVRALVTQTAERVERVMISA